MRKRQGFVLRSVCGEQFLIAEGEENIDFGNLVSMNESSVFLWNSIADGQEFTVDTLVDTLLSEYDVPYDKAREDAEDLCNDMLRGGVIVE
ncbi:PqqD family protein [Palleniella muris]|uniref:PqqD family protein n=1 Tax=Palleniella muris TaxID=3038145 RepID=A0AC61QMU4_9BACT|nr:PqqD family protein [Palleniella muris]TGX80729.1 PqqD family protein [Palleniella muris]